MKTKSLKRLILIMFLVLVLLFSINTSALTKIKLKYNFSQNMIYVNDDNIDGPWDGTKNNPYRYLQDALEFVKENSTIFIHQGMYYSSGSNEINIKKSVKLIGENKHKTIITLDSGLDHVIKISAKYVTIKNLTIDNAIIGITGKGDFFSIKNSIISNNLDGINLVSSSNILISNCKILDNFDGISLQTCPNSNISNNHIKSNLRAIRISKSSDNSKIYNNIIEKNQESGITISRSDNNQIINNKLHKNSKGIWGEAVYFYKSSRNIISKNSIYKNECNGIVFCNSCKYNKILKNTIEDNIHNSDGNYFYGLSFFKNSNYNLIYHNSFINNNHLTLSHDAYDCCDNQWYNSSINEGNYWSNFFSLDKNKDDICDNPYCIKGGNNKDFYPLKNPIVKNTKNKLENNYFEIFIDFFKILFL